MCIAQRAKSSMIPLHFGLIDRTNSIFLFHSDFVFAVSKLKHRNLILFPTKTPLASTFILILIPKTLGIL